MSILIPFLTISILGIGGQPAVGEGVSQNFVGQFGVLYWIDDEETAVAAVPPRPAGAPSGYGGGGVIIGPPEAISAPTVGPSLIFPVAERMIALEILPYPPAKIVGYQSISKKAVAEPEKPPTGIAKPIPPKKKLMPPRPQRLSVIVFPIWPFLLMIIFLILVWLVIHRRSDQDYVKIEDNRSSNNV